MRVLFIFCPICKANIGAHAISEKDTTDDKVLLQAIGESILFAAKNNHSVVLQGFDRPIALSPCTCKKESEL